MISKKNMNNFRKPAFISKYLMENRVRDSAKFAVELIILLTVHVTSKTSFTDVARIRYRIVSFCVCSIRELSLVRLVERIKWSNTIFIILNKKCFQLSSAENTSKWTYKRSGFHTRLHISRLLLFQEPYRARPQHCSVLGVDLKYSFIIILLGLNRKKTR